MTTGRQTGMTLDQLLVALNHDCPSFPTCLILNEIGEICESGESNEAAEQALVERLDSGHFNETALAFTYLTLINKKRANGRLGEVLDSFRHNPENAEVVRVVDARIG